MNEELQEAELSDEELTDEELDSVSAGRTGSLRCGVAAGQGGDEVVWATVGASVSVSGSAGDAGIAVGAAVANRGAM
jgi:hypothetical protein